MVRDPRSTPGFSRPTGLLSANPHTRVPLNPAWITEYILVLPQSRRIDGLIVLANSLNCEPRALLEILRGICDRPHRLDLPLPRRAILHTIEQLEEALRNANGTPLECSGPDRDALNEWLLMAQNHDNAEYHIAALDRIFEILKKPVPLDIRYAIGDPTQTIQPAAGKHWNTRIPLRFDDHVVSSIECRFQQGGLTRRETHVNCNVMFNPSNDSLGTRGGGGAEGAIIRAVGSDAFDEANGELLRVHGTAQRPGAPLSVPDGFVGTTAQTGALSGQGIQLLVSQVAPRQRNVDLLIQAWRNGFIQAVENLPAGENARIASTALGAGVFGWTPTESLNAAKTALSQLPPEIAARIESFVVIDLLDPQGRGASRGDAVLDAFRRVFYDNEITLQPIESPTEDNRPEFPSRRSRRRRLRRDTPDTETISAETIRRHRATSRHEARGETEPDHTARDHSERPAPERRRSVIDTSIMPSTATAAPTEESGDSNTCQICMSAQLPPGNTLKIDHVPSCPACYQTHVANLRRELQQIRYAQPRIRHSDDRLPGHENHSSGTIAITFSGNAVSNRIDNRQVAIPGKTETHYLPNNPLGQEMARLFGIINRLGLTYQIGESGTFVSAIANNNDEVSDDLPLELKNCTAFQKFHKYSTHVTVNGRRRPIAVEGEGEGEDEAINNLQSIGLQPAYGLIFRIHMKTNTHGGEIRHGYPDATYPVRFRDEIVAARNKYGFQQELDTTELDRLIEHERREGRIPPASSR